MGSGFWISPHETWNLKKSSRSCIWAPILPQRVKIEIFAVVSEILADFQNVHIWACNVEFEKRSKSGIWTLFISQVVEIGLICALQATDIATLPLIWLIRLINADQKYSVASCHGDLPSLVTLRITSLEI